MAQSAAFLLLCSQCSWKQQAYKTQFTSSKRMIQIRQAACRHAGSLQPILDGRADLALYPFFLSGSVPDGAIQTTAIFNGGLNLIVKKPVGDAQDALAFLLPFTPAVWLTIILSPFAAYIAWVLMAKLSPLCAYTVRRMRRIGGGPRQAVTEFAVESAAESFLLEAWMALIGQALVPRGRSWSVWTVSLTWGLAGVVLLAAYTASLTAILTDGTLTPKISSIGDLVRDNATAGVIKGGQVFDYISRTHDPILQLLQPNIIPADNSSQGYDWVRQGVVDAFINSNSYNLPLMARSPCDVTVAGPFFGVGSINLAVPANSTILDKLNVAIMKLSEQGVLDKLTAEYITYSATCPMPTVLPQPDSPQLGITSFRGLFYMVFVFMLVAFLYTALENAVMAIFHRNPNLHRKSAGLLRSMTGDGTGLFEIEEEERQGHQPEGEQHNLGKEHSGAAGRNGRTGASNHEETADAVLNGLVLTRFC